MKLHFTQLSVLFALCLLLSGCLGKEEEENPDNYVEYLGQSYTLRMGTYLSMELPDGRLTHSISLMNLDTQSLNFDMNEEMATLMFSIDTESAELGDGTFQYQDEMGAIGVSMAGYNYGQTFNNPTGGQQLHLTSGSIEVSRNGSAYEIRINMADEAGNPLKAYYNGTLMTNPNQ